MHEFPEPDPSASPCIKVCVLDSEQMCIGCGRLLQEIADWSQMSPAERAAVNDRAAARLRSRERR